MSWSSYTIRVEGSDARRLTVSATLADADTDSNANNANIQCSPNQPAGTCCPGAPTCVPYTKQGNTGTSKMSIAIYIGVAGVVVILIIGLILNSQRMKKVKTSVANGHPEKHKMWVSW